MRPVSPTNHASAQLPNESDVPDPLLGRLLAGRFLIVERIAKGGMGVVYKAEQLPLGREVAIKVLDRNATADPDGAFEQRFVLEAAAAAKLKHPNTIVVHDYGQTEDGMYFLAMEHIDGIALDRWVRENGPLTPAQALHVVLQICSSLRDAHERGLVHRDIKPSNIMLAPRARDPFFVKVLDFGLVKVVSAAGLEQSGLTRGGLLIGSPRYMAPEQVRMVRVDHRADIYSVGATLYHLVAGAPPFASGNRIDTVLAHVTTPPPPLNATWADCPVGPRFEAVVMRCLEKEPDARFASMDELMGALLECSDEVGGSVARSIPPLSMPPAESSESTPNSAVPSGVRWKPQRDSTAGDFEVLPIDVEQAGGVLAPRNKRIWLGLGALVFVGLGLAVALLPTPFAAPSPSRAFDSAPVRASSRVVDPAPALVTVRSVPAGATIRHERHDIGDAPVGVPVPAGERWDVEVVLEGYETRRVTMLSGQPELTVNLRPIASAQLARSRALRRPTRPTARRTSAPMTAALVRQSAPNVKAPRPTPSSAAPRICPVTGRILPPLPQ